MDNRPNDLARAASAPHLSQILEQAREAIIVTDLHGVITLWNPGAERLFGYAAAEAMGRDIRDLLYFPEDAPDIPARIRSLGREGGVAELRHRHKNGEARWIRLSSSLLRDDAGHACGVIGYSEDVTAQRQMMAELAHSEALYRSLAESVPATVFSSDGAGNLDYINSHWLAYTGLSLEASLGKGWQQAIHPDDRAAIAVSWHEPAPQPAGEQEFRLRRHDGAWRWNLLRILPVNDSPGASRRWVGSIVDIHERRETESRTQAANTELAQVNTEIEFFAYAVGHDLAEPARTISSFSTLLSRNLTEPVLPIVTEALGHIRSATERLRELGTGLTTYARAGRGDLTLTRVSLKGVYYGAVLMLQPAIQRTSATLTCGDDLPSVDASEPQLNQVVQNLIGNALKYAGTSPPVVHFDARLEDDQWLIWVEDRGPGIPAEYLEQVFTPFRRLHGRDVPGTGLGLAIARRIIERHGGRMWAESTPGAGAKFLFTLPA